MAWFFGKTERRRSCGFVKHLSLSLALLAILAMKSLSLLLCLLLLCLCRWETTGETRLHEGPICKSTKSGALDLVLLYAGKRPSSCDSLTGYCVYSIYPSTDSFLQHVFHCLCFYLMVYVSLQAIAYWMQSVSVFPLLC